MLGWQQQHRGMQDRGVVLGKGPLSLQQQQQ
jgi:hypothetical protein